MRITIFIKTDGKVGIGTIAPGANLDSDTDTVWSSGWANNLRLTSLYYPCLRFFAQASNKTSLIGNNNDGGLWFGVNGSGDAYSGYGMVIQPDGKVGIGTNVPSAKLHVLDSSNQIRVECSSDNQKWDISAAGGDFDIYDATNNKTPFAIDANTPSGFFEIKSNSSLLLTTATAYPYFKITTTSTNTSAMSYIQLNTTAG